MSDTDPEIRSFEIGRVLGEDEDPVVPFKLHDREFHMHPKRVNGLLAGDLGSKALRIAQDSRPMWEFLDGLLGDEAPAFRELVRDPRLQIDADKFRELVSWMLEQTTAHPS